MLMPKTLREAGLFLGPLRRMSIASYVDSLVSQSVLTRRLAFSGVDSIDFQPCGKP